MIVARKQVMQRFSQAAAAYDVHAQFQHVQTARVLDAALMLLPARARVLDIGCGTGMFARAAQLQRPEWEMMGVDLAFGMCAASGAVQADAIALPFADGSMDAVVSSLCLQWVEDLDAAFAEIARVLKPGGRAILASLGAESLKELRGAASAADLPLQLLPMRDAANYRAAMAGQGLSVTLFERDAQVEYFSNVTALMDSMRRIGAGNNFSQKTQGLGLVSRWKAMTAAYEKLRVARGLPATWDRFFMICTRSSSPCGRRLGGGGLDDRALPSPPPHPNPLPQGERE